MTITRTLICEGKESRDCGGGVKYGATFGEPRTAEPPSETHSETPVASGMWVRLDNLTEAEYEALEVSKPYPVTIATE